MKKASENSFLLYLENKKTVLKVIKCPTFLFFKPFFHDNSDILYLEQTQACHIFPVACFNFLV